MCYVGVVPKTSGDDEVPFVNIVHCSSPRYRLAGLNGPVGVDAVAIAVGRGKDAFGIFTVGDLDPVLSIDPGVIGLDHEQDVLCAVVVSAECDDLHLSASVCD